MQVRDLETTHPLQDLVIRAIRALFRSSVLVVIVLWIFALRDGYAGSDGLVYGVALSAVAAGSLAGGLVGARPRLLGLAISALSPCIALAFMLSSALPLRAELAGESAGLRLEAALPLVVAGAILLAFACASAGDFLRRRYASMHR